MSEPHVVRISPDLKEKMLRADPRIAKRIVMYRKSLAAVGTLGLIAAQLAVIDETTERCDAIEDVVRDLGITSQQAAADLDEYRKWDATETAAGR